MLLNHHGIVLGGVKRGQDRSQHAEQPGQNLHGSCRRLVDCGEDCCAHHSREGYRGSAQYSATPLKRPGSDPHTQLRQRRDASSTLSESHKPNAADHLWLEEVEQHDVKDLHVFANGVRKDLAAVTAGLTVSWNSGAVEGHVNRVKMLKRQHCGRRIRPPQTPRFAGQLTGFTESAEEPRSLRPQRHAPTADANAQPRVLARPSAQGLCRHFQRCPMDVPPSAANHPKHRKGPPAQVKGPSEA